MAILFDVLAVRRRRQAHRAEAEWRDSLAGIANILVLHWG
jgi:hypothetical protein